MAENPAKATRTQTYLTFAGEVDILSYQTMHEWSADAKHAFVLNDARDLRAGRGRARSVPASLLPPLQERLDCSKHLVLIVGENPPSMRQSILQYEIRYALTQALPIIIAFTGYSATEENTNRLWQERLFPRIPTVLHEWHARKYCLVCPFTRGAVVSAITKYSDKALPRTHSGYMWHWKH